MDKRRAGRLDKPSPKRGRPKIYDATKVLPNTTITKEMEKRMQRFLDTEQAEAVSDALRKAPTTMSDAVRILVQRGLDATEKETK